MAKIALSDTFTIIPEGTHIFKITKVEYKEEFGKLNVHMETKNGEKHIERFSFIKGKGEPNMGAINAFTFFARTALQDFETMEIDHEDLIGCFIKCEVLHNEVPSTKNEGEFVTFVQLGKKYTADGFEEDDNNSSSEKPKEKPANKPKTTIDLDELLG